MTTNGSDVLRDSAALATYARRRLAEQPLTSGEMRRGCALRVVSCVRANDEDLEAEPSGFVWTVLLFSRSSAPASVGLSGLFASYARARSLSTAGAFLARAALRGANEGWNVFEYALFVPRALRWFGVSSSCGASCFVGRARRNAMIREHFEQICNAAADDAAYAAWSVAHKRRIAALEVPHDGPLVSILCPVYKTPPDFLRAMLSSVTGQTYGRWELVVVNASPDDPDVARVLAEYPDERIRVVDCPENKGIAGNTNLGLEQCAGDYVCFLDHDDFVEPQALAAMVGAVLASDAPVDLVYCDEDSINEDGVFKIPIFKPGFNPDLLCSNDYVLHWLMVSRHVLEHSRRSGKEVDGAQDFDLTFKALECARAGARSVVRVPYVLYHWRIHEGSMNNNPASKQYAQESGRRAIADHLARRGIEARVVREKTPSTYRTDFAVPVPRPTLACVSLGTPADALTSALDACGVPRDAASRVVLPADAAPDRLADALAGLSGDVALVVAEGVALSAEDLGLVLGYFARPEVFAVSPRLLHVGGLVDYAGAIVTPEGELCKLGRCLPAADEGYIGRLHRPYSAAVLNADCIALRRADLAGIAPASGYASCAYMLADLCLRAYGQGRVNVFTPFAVARWEAARSLAVGYPFAEPCDAGLLAARHAALIGRGDPSHNPNFDPHSPHYRLADLT